MPTDGRRTWSPVGDGQGEIRERCKELVASGSAAEAITHHTTRRLMIDDLEFL